MTKYSIHSKANAFFGVYEGATPQAALAKMAVEAGNEIGDESFGTIDDWYVRPVQYVIEGRTDAHGWSMEVVWTPGARPFDTEADAMAAIDELVRADGWPRNDLRVIEA
ncbi:MAG: hypothetical protein O9345_15940 [Burkholderiaceae bacterium]|nr:hypothetical protein [Burkholderiales bacterium]MCZ8339616.1 hypothetical protein [Burkholderiaceae bacterium]